ncbi:MAG: ArsA-related P-loop ATPase, partial [Pseudomonadota bacterium]
KHWRESQRQYMEKAEEYFAPVPIFPVNLFNDEILGYRRLKDLAEKIYGDRNPLERFFEGEPYQLTKKDGRYQLRIKVPFIARENIELNKVSDELVVRVGSFKQHVLLPRHVAASKSVKARLEGQHLYVYFGGEDDHG